MILQMVITIRDIQSVCLLIILNDRHNRVVSILLLLLSHILDELIVNRKQVCFWSRIVVLTINIAFKHFLVWNRGHSTFDLADILSQLRHFRLIMVHLVLRKNGLTKVNPEILVWCKECQVTSYRDARIVLILVSFEYLNWRHTLQTLMFFVVMSTICGRCNIVIGKVRKTIIRC